MNLRNAVLTVLLTAFLCSPLFLFSMPEGNEIDARVTGGPFPGELSCANADCHNVTPNIGGGPTHEVTGVFNAASFLPTISPGGIAAVGGFFAETSAESMAVPLSLDLGGFSVTFDGEPGYSLAQGQ